MLKINLAVLLCTATIITAEIPNTDPRTIDIANELDCPVIKTTLGNISGIRQQTVFGNHSFCSYRGIRYGEAPVGKLRFKAPVKSSQWNETYKASKYGAACIQQSFGGFKPDNVSEDCLFLNVFVPSSLVCNSSSDIAVIVWIYGGSFTEGAAFDTLYGPHLLMNDCVIVVTLNYRVGMFGFLPLALPEMSGNMGLKDQQLALEWVHGHISAFGGNSKQVTLMGQSAGSASVCFHRLNAKSRSLLTRVYASGSSALTYYALSESNNKTDLIVELARNQSIIIENTDQLIEYIETVDVDYIVNHTSHFGGYGMVFETPWQPCIEPKFASDAFLTEAPEVLLAKGVDVPTVYSYASMEYIIFLDNVLANPSSISYLDTNFTFLLPFRGLNQKACEQEIAPLFSDIRQFYFGKAVINASQILPYVQLTSSMNFAYSIQKEIVLQALSKSKAKIMLLRFDHKTALSMSLDIPGAAELGGISHGDDLCNYFWCEYMSASYEDTQLQETLSQRVSFKVSKIFRELITNYAINGNPTSETAAFGPLVPTTSEPLTNFPFTELLRVGTLAAGTNPDHEELRFWWDIDQQVQKIKKMPCNQE